MEKSIELRWRKSSTLPDPDGNFLMFPSPWGGDMWLVLEYRELKRGADPYPMQINSGWKEVPIDKEDWMTVADKTVRGVVTTEFECPYCEHLNHQDGAFQGDADCSNCGKSFYVDTSQAY